MTIFSIIVTDYDRWVSRGKARYGLHSLNNQSFRDFEIVLMHDGPRSRDVEADLEISKITVPIRIINTAERHNKWGHPQRDIGMQQSVGKYIVHFNIDNYLEPCALLDIYNYLSKRDVDGVVFPIRQHTPNRVFYLAGYPPVHCGIDCLQLVTSREVWESVGWWYDYSESSDGYIYQKIYSLYQIGFLDKVLGDNYISQK